MIALVVAACIGLGVYAVYLVRNENLAALENLDDEELAGAVADEWNAA